MANGILVFIEHVDGKVNKASYEAVRAAQLISGATGQAVSAVIFGSGIGAAAGEVAAKKLSAVYTVENDALKSYTADGYSAAFKQVIEQLQPELVLMTHTYEVRDFAPKLAASLRRALVGDCIGHKVEGGELVLTRQVFQGKMAADV
ncbi:MAG: electron transfer flavoprotein subunit alpha/FixB family protein, partial [Blastocatellia bacterium]|nr:electron transfer flavoprotein subunit alpha/FixB family protein [Blastocatellia bacterium]